MSIRFRRTLAHPPVRSSRVAVAVHVFYPELWDELVAQLANLQEPFDLYVSLVGGHSHQLAEPIRQRFVDAAVKVVPNRGRDIAGFLAFVAAGELSGYRAVLKLHTKRSHHRVDGDEWRQALWHGLLPSPEGVRILVDRLLVEPDVGCIVPRGNVLDGSFLGSSVGRMSELLVRGGWDRTVSEVEFAAGSMYWLDGRVIEALRALSIHPVRDFEPEVGQVDGTTAHAVERLVGALVKGLGMRIAHSEDLIDLIES